MRDTLSAACRQLGSCRGSHCQQVLGNLTIRSYRGYRVPVILQGWCCDESSATRYIDSPFTAWRAVIGSRSGRPTSQDWQASPTHSMLRRTCCSKWLWLGTTSEQMGPQAVNSSPAWTRPCLLGLIKYTWLWKQTVLLALKGLCNATSSHCKINPR